MALARRARQGGLVDRFEDDVLRNALLGRDDLDDAQNLFAHVTRPCGESPFGDAPSASTHVGFTIAAPVSRFRFPRAREAMLDAALVDDDDPVPVSPERAG